MLLSSLKDALGSFGKRRATRALEAAYRKSTERGRDAMRIVFADSALAYTAATPYEQPLGGSQSAVCYLAEALAAAGHECVLVTKTQSVGRYRGVTCTGWSVTSPHALRDFKPHAVVAQIAPAEGPALRQIFSDATPFILWEQFAHDQPSVQPLGDARVRDTFDGICAVSHWQKKNFVAAFGIDAARIRVIGNGLSPAFENMFAAGENITASKARPPVLAYTSTPYRGLNVLLSAFPEIRRRVPGARLRVYSSMRVYQASAEEEARYARLYGLCRTTEGVEYIGSLPQPELAGAMREVTVFGYPNTFAETYCIAALEAMAAGCSIVTTDFGGLPQTTAGFARLIPPVNEGFAESFVDAVVETLQAAMSGSDADRLSRQVAYVNETCTWRARAREWTQWLDALRVGSKS